MGNEKQYWARLPLSGAENCRDLGGYETHNGGQTSWHRFLRSSDLNKLTTEDIAFLEAYGLTTVIDLRSEDEVKERHNPLSKESFCTYHNIPLIKQIMTEPEDGVVVSFGDFYKMLLQDSPYIKTVFDVIAGTEKGTILFHCTAGKDRTGVIALLLLGLAGVKRKDIIGNYEVSYTFMESFKRLKEEGLLPKEVPSHYLESRREYIEEAYDYIIDTYGDFESYLKDKDLLDDTIKRVKEKLCVTS